MLSVPSSNCRVITLTSTYPRWGGDNTPSFVFDLISNLTALGWVITVLAPGFYNARPEENLSGVTVQRFSYMIPTKMQTLCYGGGVMPNIRAFPLRSLLVIPFFIAGLLAARRLVRREKPAIVHAHWVLPMGLVAMLVTPRSIPLVITAHGSDVLELRWPVLNWLKRKILSRADVVTCNGSRTEAAVDTLASPGKSIKRIPMGAEPARPGVVHDVLLPNDRFILLFAGRLFRGKGLDDLLLALESFSTADRPYLLVAGDGPETDRFKACTVKSGISEDVQFLGGLAHDRLLTLMKDVNAIVVPTRNTEWVEGQGLLVAEAMFACKPVIATYGGGAEDHIEHGVNGLLVPPANPIAIEKAVRDLISNPGLASAIGRAGEEYATAHLSWEKCATSFDAVYNQLVR